MHTDENFGNKTQYHLSHPFPHRLTIYFYIPARFAAKNRAPEKRGNYFYTVPRFFSLPYFKIITQQSKKQNPAQRYSVRCAGYISPQTFWKDTKSVQVFWVICHLLWKLLMIYYSTQGWNKASKSCGPTPSFYRWSSWETNWLLQHTKGSN